MILRDI